MLLAHRSLLSHEPIILRLAVISILPHIDIPHVQCIHLHHIPLQLVSECSIHTPFSLTYSPREESIWSYNGYFPNTRLFPRSCYIYSKLGFFSFLFSPALLRTYLIACLIFFFGSSFPPFGVLATFKRFLFFFQHKLHARESR
jgi:hypothetical protein